MNKKTLENLEKLVVNYRDIEAQLTRSEVVSDQEKYRRLSAQHSRHKPLMTLYARYCQCQDEAAALDELLNDDDAAIKAAAHDELAALKTEMENCERDITQMLLNEDDAEVSHVYLEIRAGTGGREAAIFAGDLYRMYMRYAEIRQWKTEILNSNEGEQGGFREVIVRLSGDDAYARMKFESGVHHVQRVPVTESQGRLHTSAATVAVLPETRESDEIEIKPEDIRVDTFRASGAGGQHINKTDSAIRITHLESNLSVECQSERSQHRNRMSAMKLLKAKLLDMERAKQREGRAKERRGMVGSGDRSERIRTYNFPQGRVTDHRIQLTLYQLTKCMEGTLDPLIDKLVGAERAAQLTRDIS